MIGRALKWFSGVVDERGLLTLVERMMVRDLALRFLDWGGAWDLDEKPRYRRSRR